MFDAKFVLNFSCDDRPGIVAAVAQSLAANGGNIIEAEQFEDQATSRFFMRVQFGFATSAQAELWQSAFTQTATELGLNYRVRPAGQRLKILILVSKFDHCLADLLYRWRIGELAVDIVGVVSNHPRETYAHLDLKDQPFH